MLRTISADLTASVEIEIRAKTVAVFEFTAERRVPGHDYEAFATGEDSEQVGESAYRLLLHGPLLPHTALRINLLINGAAGRTYRIEVKFSQNAAAVTDPVNCDGVIGKNGTASHTVEAVFVRAG